MIAGINKICDEPGPTLDCKVAPLNHCSYSYFFISKQFNWYQPKVRLPYCTEGDWRHTGRALNSLGYNHV